MVKNPTYGIPSEKGANNGQSSGSSNLLLRIVVEKNPIGRKLLGEHWMSREDTVKETQVTRSSVSEEMSSI